MEFDKAIFQERFRILRGKSRQSDLAVDLGISRASIGYYENGTRTPDIETLFKIANHFNVSSDWLLGMPERDNPSVIVVEKSIFEFSMTELSEALLCKSRLIESD